MPEIFLPESPNKSLEKRINEILKTRLYNLQHAPNEEPYVFKKSKRDPIKLDVIPKDKVLQAVPDIPEDKVVERLLQDPELEQRIERLFRNQRQMNKAQQEELLNLGEFKAEGTKRKRKGSHGTKRKRKGSHGTKRKRKGSHGTKRKRKGSQGKKRKRRRD